MNRGKEDAVTNWIALIVTAVIVVMVVGCAVVAVWLK